jgi:hypothetical protein
MDKQSRRCNGGVAVTSAEPPMQPTLGATLSDNALNCKAITAIYVYTRSSSFLK